MEEYRIEDLNKEIVSEWKRTLYDINSRFLKYAKIDSGKHLKKLLDLGFDINHRSADGSTPVFSAAKRDEKLLDAFIENGADVNVVNLYGFSPLFCLLHKLPQELQKPEIMRKLIKAGADVNSVNLFGDTVLAVAARTNEVSLVKVLLEAGADVEKKNHRGYSALMAAAMNKDDNPEIVKMLIKAGADVEAKTIRGTTAVQNSALQGNLNCLKALVEAGADVNSVDYEGMSVLMNVCRQQHGGETEKLLACIDYLLENGADVDYENDYGKTVLDELLKNKNEAVRNSFLADKIRGMMKKKHPQFKMVYEDENFDINQLTKEQVSEWKSRFHDINPLFLRLAEIDDGKHIKKLLELGFDINHKNFLGRSFLGDARQVSPLVMKELLANGAKVNTVDKFFSTPLWNAVRAKNLENIKLLVQVGADINAANKFGDTPLIFCSRFGYLQMLKLLLELGADINKSNQGQTPLMYACSWGVDSDEENIKIVETLISHGADIDRCDCLGESAVYYAVEFANPKRLKILIEAGADVNQPDCWGRTPLMLCCCLGDNPERRLECIELLLDAGADVNHCDDDGKTALSILKNNRSELMKNSPLADRIERMI